MFSFTFPATSYRKHLIQSDNLSCPSNVSPTPPHENGTDPSTDQPVSWEEINCCSVIRFYFSYKYFLITYFSNFLVLIFVFFSGWPVCLGRVHAEFHIRKFFLRVCVNTNSSGILVWSKTSQQQVVIWCWNSSYVRIYSINASSCQNKLLPSSCH